MLALDREPERLGGPSAPEDPELAEPDAALVLRRALDRRDLRGSMKMSLVKQLKNEPGAEDGDGGAEKRAECDEDEDAGVVVSCV